MNRAAAAADGLSSEEAARFMVEFGILSSLFDLLTFAMLLTVVRAGWRHVPHGVVRRVAPDRAGDRAGGEDAEAVLPLAIPYLPFVRLLGFVPLPAAAVVALAAITAAYVVAAEATKSWFYRQVPA